MTFNFKSLYSASYMIREEQKQGVIPEDKKIYKNTWNIAFPAMMDSFLVSLVSMMDTIMVGGLGSAAIAAVAITNQPKFIILATFIAMNVGVTAVVARRRGEGDRAGANRALGQAVSISMLLSIIISALGFIFARPLLIFAGSQPDMIDASVIYFKILMIGIPFTAVTLCINAAQRGSGNTKIAMRINLTANIINVIFNFLLINGKFGFPALGIAGAAIATVLGNIVGFFMAASSLMHRDQFLRLNKKLLFPFDKTIIKPIFNIALSAGVEQIFMRIGFFTYIKIVASLGTTELAAHNICMNLVNISFAFSDGLGVSASSLIGQSLGKARSDLAMIYGKVCQRISLVIALVMFLFFTLGGKYMVMLFSREAEILAMASPLLLIIAINTPFQYSQTIFSSGLRGAGDTKFTAFVAMISIGIIRPGLSWFLCYPVGLGLIGAWLGFLSDQLVRFTLSYYRFHRGNWYSIKV